MKQPQAEPASSLSTYLLVASLKLQVLQVRLGVTPGPRAVCFLPSLLLSVSVLRFRHTRHDDAFTLEKLKQVLTFKIYAAAAPS